MNALFTYSLPMLSVEALKHSIAYKLMFMIGKDLVVANKHEWLNAMLFAVRDCLVERWLCSNCAQLLQETCQVYYLLMEFLIGCMLSNAMLLLGIYEDVQGALEVMGLNLEELIDEENDLGLGNGGLGCLVACFLDSLAMLGLLGRGYGICYDYGMFKQNIVNGSQKELPDYWLEYGNLWEFKCHNTCYKVCFGGCIQQEGKKMCWIETEEILGVAYDQIIPGYDTDVTNMLCLWSVQASSEINLGKFNQGDYFVAVEDKNHSENVSRVLYLDDSTYSGCELCLCQEYFLVSLTIQDILSCHYQLHKTYDNLVDKIVIHLNDTHLVLLIPEMMCLLIDEHQFSWDDVFEVCCQVFSYTNHMLMSEVLETWLVDMLGKILLCHLQIIFEINDYFLKTLQEQYLNDTDLLGWVLIIDESNGCCVCMAWLVVVVSHKVNGVLELHSNLMVQLLFADFVKIFLGCFTNVTNGVTLCRWLVVVNPLLSAVLDEHLGCNWCTDLSLLNELQQHCDFPMVNHAVHQVKLENKKCLAEYIAQQLNVVVNPKVLFDVQIKCIHEYKCQLMNVLHVITCYNCIKADLDVKWVLCVNIFGGKVALAYYMAKHIIHLINDVVKVINNDLQIGDKLKVVFILNYSVSLAQLIILVADLSEQISLVGMEASGTSNMKFVLNGVLTIGMLDGVNVEMLDHVGADNIFIFGNTVEEVEELCCQGYKLCEYYEKDEELHQVLMQIGSGVFSLEDLGCYCDLVDLLINFGDHYQVLVDYCSYVDCQDKVDELYELQEEWTAKAMLNIANMGYFSSDCTIKEYADYIWHIDLVRL